MIRILARYLLVHRHQPEECRIVFTAWKGFDSPLRAKPTLGSCRNGHHGLWWTVEASDPETALAQLPRYVAERTEAFEVGDVLIP